MLSQCPPYLLMLLARFKWCDMLLMQVFKIMRPERNDNHFAENIFKCIFLIQYLLCILIKIFVLCGPIDNKPASVQVMAWHQTGDKPLPEPLMTKFSEAYMPQYASLTKAKYTSQITFATVSSCFHKIGSWCSYVQTINGCNNECLGHKYD